MLFIDASYNKSYTCVLYLFQNFWSQTTSQSSAIWFYIDCCYYSVIHYHWVPVKIIILLYHIIFHYLMGSLWSYGSWIYNYMCNQYLSPIKVVSSNVTHGVVYSIKYYVIKFVSDLRQVFYGYSGFLQQ